MTNLMNRLRKKTYVLIVIAAVIGVGFLITLSTAFSLNPSQGLPPHGMSIVSCGATANDATDDYAAIVSCVNKAKAKGTNVYVPPGNFLVSDQITLDGVSMKGDSEETSILTSTNPEKGSIDIQGANVVLSHLKHVYATTVPRGDGANDKNSITVRGATNFTIEHVHVQKASTAGILVMDKSNIGMIVNNTVEGTGADGIHITDGSQDITIEGNVVKEAGDDTIAVVSYLEDGHTTQRITIKNNDVGYNSQARGISVVGGADVTIEDNQIQETQMAGIYISVEEQWDTGNTERITVNRNKVERTGLRPNSDHPNILVYASHGVLNHITFNDNIISKSAHGGIGVWGDGTIGDIYFNGNKLTDSQDSPTIFKSGNIHLNNNQGF